MPVAEIIRKIDEYLSRLREARDLLAGLNEGAPRGRRASSPRPAKVVKAAVSARNSRQPVKRRSATVRETGETAGPAELPQSSVTVSVVEIRPAETPNRVAAELPIEPTPQSGGNRARLRAIRTSPYRPKAAAIPEIVRTATPLGGAVPSGVVVASAAEAQRARDRAVKREVKQEILAVTPRTGKAAFEALFGDGTEPSGSSSA